MLFLIGAAFGMRARRGGSLWAARTFLCAAAANAVLGIALPVAAYLSYPAWMWGYYVDPARVSPAVVALVFLLYWIPFLLGYVLPRKLEERRRGSAGWALAGGAAAQAALLAWQWPRYRTVTTLEGFRAGLQLPPSEIPLLQIGPPVALAIAAVLFWLARPSPKAP